jgi:hypothetical protein
MSNLIRGTHKIALVAGIYLACSVANHEVGGIVAVGGFRMNNEVNGANGQNQAAQAQNAFQGHRANHAGQFQGALTSFCNAAKSAANATKNVAKKIMPLLVLHAACNPHLETAQHQLFQ